VNEEAGTLSALTPVLPGREQQLEAVLGRLPPGTQSPLARVARIHFARWVVVPYFQDRRGQPLDPTSYLLFSSWFDGSVEAYLDSLRESMRSEADAIWSNCVGYPRTDSPAEFRAYLLAHRIVPSYPFAAYPGETVAHVRAGLKLRKRLVAFAAASQGRGAEELQRSWRETFHREGA
jgi:hypothetical protein